MGYSDFKKINKRDKKTCQKNKIKIEQRLILTDKKSVNFYPNFFGALALYKLISK